MTSSAAKHDVFQAIADPSRRKLLKLLADKEMPVNEICEHFPMTRTAVSKHLRILSEAKLVSMQKVGRESRYKLEAGGLIEVKEWVSFYERYWDNKLSMLRHLVENDGAPVPLHAAQSEREQD
ncbi:ArsR family transcriptional regulator [Paenibacillus yonginensis]|uniref:ArsR family transcriptional regulator n=1 Tax=Paenibacillus yonginensis TaxID=1462996 RepID=A0A1B1N3A5_9BACL|nr:metalloregulator ArsR/SmtB family transcription factor [Paenibacillus yonginensis]ANS75886.1 ArsR family transcriptional regulator [Paenibacillus yonginensis]